MNTEVNYEIAKLLAQKGFPQNNIDYGIISSIGKNDNNDLIFGETYACPNISQVIMWLYEKHGMWITVLKRRNEREEGFVAYNNDKVIDDKIFFKLHSSPTEAYLSAINYYLKDLV